MAIQTRRGPEKDFDPNKLLPGEFAGTTDTKRIFYAFAAGDTKEMATYEDMRKEINKLTGDIVAELTDGVETAITNTNKATESANQAAEDANTAKAAAETATKEASDAASEAREAAEAALSKGVSGIKGDKETKFRTGNVNLTSEDIGAVEIGGDVAENTVAFTSNDAGPDGEYAILSVEKLTTGEKLSSLMNKVSRIFTNTRYILKLLGNNDITSESAKIGDGTVTGAIRTLNDNLLDKTYPVGSIYMSVKNVNPSTLFGGAWVEWGSGRVPVGVNTSDSNFKTVEKTGGASTVTLTTAQLPSHSHGSVPIHTSGIETKGYGLSTTNYFQDRVAIAEANSGENFKTGNTGSGSAHNNLQPYITCYMWKRTA